jgi:hypothetical protein
MILKLEYLKNFTVIPTLQLMGEKFSGEDANFAVLSTIAHESHMGTWRKQIGGPALGIGQCEKITYDWLSRKYKDILLKFFPEIPPFEVIENDDVLAVIMCRLRYYVVPEKLPDAGDIKAMARYWKEYYNTKQGKGNEQEFVRNYKKFVEMQSP